jgi:hypothetical protein
MHGCWQLGGSANPGSPAPCLKVVLGHGERVSIRGDKERGPRGEIVIRHPRLVADADSALSGGATSTDPSGRRMSLEPGGRGREPSGLLGYPTATFWATIWRLRRMARTSTGCWTRRRRGGRPSVGPKLEAVAAAAMPGGAIRPVKARSPRVNSVRKVAKKATGGRAQNAADRVMSEPSLDSIRWRRSDGRTDARSGPTSRPGHRQDRPEQECRSARYAQQRAGEHRGERHRDRHPPDDQLGYHGVGDAALVRRQQQHRRRGVAQNRGPANFPPCGGGRASCSSTSKRSKPALENTSEASRRPSPARPCGRPGTPDWAEIVTSGAGSSEAG